MKPKFTPFFWDREKGIRLKLDLSENRESQFFGVPKEYKSACVGA